MKQIDDPKFARAVVCFRMALLTRQRLRHHLERCTRLYGVAGNVLSGGHCPHWPEAEKRKSRRLNRAYNRLDNAGFAARPKHGHLITMRMLRHEVQMQTIRQQHGISA